MILNQVGKEGRKRRMYSEGDEECDEKIALVPAARNAGIYLTMIAGQLIRVTAWMGVSDVRQAIPCEGTTDYILEPFETPTHAHFMRCTEQNRRRNQEDRQRVDKESWLQYSKKDPVRARLRSAYIIYTSYSRF